MYYKCSVPQLIFVLGPVHYRVLKCDITNILIFKIVRFEIFRKNKMNNASVDSLLYSSTSRQSIKDYKSFSLPNMMALKVSLKSHRSLGDLGYTKSSYPTPIKNKKLFISQEMTHNRLYSALLCTAPSG